jgi:diaminopimelate decarboxylase
VAFLDAGAYAFVAASNYNSRCRGAEVMVAGERFAVVRKRETFEDLLSGESVPGGPFVFPD